MYIENLQKIINEIKVSKNGYEAANKLFESAEQGLSEMKNGVLFKCGEYMIQNLFKAYGAKYEENLKLLSSFDLSIIPEYIETIIKDEDMFIITKIDGCKNGDLKRYYEVKDSVCEKNKNIALEDLMKLLEKGYTDDKIYSSADLWFVAPGNNKIILPSFESLRKVNCGEEEVIIKSYKRILFEI